MRVLLDTNVFVRGMNNRPIPRYVRRLMEETTTELFISIVSAWEIVMKMKLGHTVADVEQAIRGVDATLLPIKFTHLDALSGLPFYEHHKDPFDRMLIAQALAEGLPIVSSDMNFEAYTGLQIIWD